MNRRRFLESAGTLTALAAGARTAPAEPAASPAEARAAAAPAGSPKKAVLITMLPKELSYLERFKLAGEVGFEGLEAQTAKDPRVADEIKEASVKSGLRIHSVMNMDHWSFPLSSDNPEDVNKSVAGMETSLRNAKLWGADAVLLVPAVVNPKTLYRDAYTRSQKVIRERLLPMAADLRIVIAVEEVWNKFLLSPTEFAQYVDEFRSPWVRAYFDVGNVVLYGYPQDWIRTLGKRIVKMHLKDFAMDRSGGRFYWKHLGEGDIDWPEIRKAMAEVGYDGYTTTEIPGGDAAYLKDVVARLERFYAGERPVARS